MLTRKLSIDNMGSASTGVLPNDNTGVLSNDNTGVLLNVNTGECY